MTHRYAAYALAMELGIWNVDAMLHDMNCAQFNEWMAFLNVRARTLGGPTQQVEPQKKYGDSREEQQRMSRDILKAFQGWQKKMPDKKPH